MNPHKNFIIGLLEFFAVLISSTTWILLVNQTLQALVLLIAVVTGFLGLRLKWIESTRRKKKNPD